MKTSISIISQSSISALGSQFNEIWDSYLNDSSCISKEIINNELVNVASLSKEIKNEIEDLRVSDSKYKSLDNSVLFAILVARNAVKNAGWDKNDVFGINIGSSRGATALFEEYHEEFLKTKRVSLLASPTTTLGNISSWVANDLRSQGPDISHSITCSTAFHAILNGIAWINAGFVNKFLVGGSEAPITPFTIAQMKALKIYSRITDSNYPCLALDLNKRENTMVIGEAASVVCLENGIKENAIAVIEGIGYATEILEHNISISTEADCFQKSMKMALENVSLNDVDVIVMHAPGTIKGDLSEFKAIQKVFGSKTPLLTSNKWKVGHTFATSGMLSLELAILMLQKQEFIGIPYVNSISKKTKINKVLINAVGFGGNAVSILISK
ncbi:beta-ketoacyl synthase N-terminal-like domain-containing protein [Flavobacterium sp. N2270]|uniref:beta-ketoacyl synthase N-terminal-like domain-containing protein n=1 Tax=Flavobacterium sp. N2270 TaxID=2986831 RepID=UPI0022257C46|nr:beta-ketoacyl synthase N-terminal-like domain-containing protein [Flavobacterium sp. N2270]